MRQTLWVKRESPLCSYPKPPAPGTPLSSTSWREGDPGKRRADGCLGECGSGENGWTVVDRTAGNRRAVEGMDSPPECIVGRNETTRAPVTGAGEQRG